MTVRGGQLSQIFFIAPIKEGWINYHNTNKLMEK
jgi:hypothetical protein